MCRLKNARTGHLHRCGLSSPAFIINVTEDPCRMNQTRRIVFLLCCIPAALSSAEEPVFLNVMTYNIHYGQGMDQQYDVARLARVINDAKPDLVALQEVDVVVHRSGRIHQAKELGKLTGMAVRFGPSQHYQGGLFGNAVLSRLPILNVEIEPLSYTEATPDRVTYPRAAICVTVETSSGKPLKFISTHFQHNVEEDRVHEARDINRLFVGEDSVPTILGGDINAIPESEPLQILQEKWTHASTQPNEPTAPSKNPKSRIDYLFCRPQSRFEVIDSRVIAEETASDHRPVFARLRLLD